MHLKQISRTRNTSVGRSYTQDISHGNVMVRLRSKRVNCVRFQTLEILYNNTQGETVSVGPCPVSTVSDRAYLTQHRQFKNAMLTWLKQSDMKIPVHVELDVRSLVNRNCYITPISDMLKNAYHRTRYACEYTPGVTLTTERAMLVFPTINGHHVRLDFRFKRNKYVTYFSITHPDRVVEKEDGTKVPLVYAESRYGFILGARGLYSLLNGWYMRSVSPNADMLKAVGPELLALINSDRRPTIDEFFTVINGQVASHASIP